MSTIAFIPLRGGSKSIPYKNVQTIGGKALALWAIEAAVACDAIDKVYVATDNDRIAATARSVESGKVVVIGRSVESAADTASSEMAMLEFAAGYEFDKMVLIQATSPLVRAEDLSGGLRQYDEDRADSLVSVVEQKRFLWSRDAAGLGVPENYDPRLRPRRQECVAHFVENGAFYICQKEGLLSSRSRLFGRISLYVMPPETYYEIDEYDDWAIVENLLSVRHQQSGTVYSISRTDIIDRVERIKLVLMDVDGVLTDSGMYYSERGDELKKFNTRDGKAVELLHQAGIRTGIVTSENTELVKWRASKLAVDYLFQGCVDKLEIVNSIANSANVKMDEIAYIGDDLGDLHVLRKVGLSACPRDAVAAVREASHVCCSAKGGEGAVRELAELILRSRQ